jgi:cell division protein FtsL
LRVVERGERTLAAKRRRARVLALVTVGVLAAMVFGLVGVHVSLAQNQLRLDRLNAKAAAEQVTYERLRLQVAQLESPARIVKEAADRGMVMPPGVTYLSPPPVPPAAATALPSGSAAAPAASSDWTEVKPELAARP